MKSDSRLVAAGSVRFASTNRFNLSPQAQEQLGRLQSFSSSFLTQVTRPTVDAPRTNQKKHSKLSVTVAPIGPVKSVWESKSRKILPEGGSGPPKRPKTKSGDALKAVDATQTQLLFRESMRLIHESEAVVVIEYIETVVPVFYALYISIFFHLPNARYYQDMAYFSAEKLHRVVANILIYAAMELLSLVWVHRILQRSFGVSVFYQLAFTMGSE